METIDQARRRFLKTVIPILGALLFLVRYLTPRLVAPRRRLEVNPAEIPPGGALVYPESRVAVIRSDSEVYALDLTCTHLGCTVGVLATGLVCPCHGSRFDRAGNVVEGPANRSLRRLTVNKQGSKLLVLI